MSNCGCAGNRTATCCNATDPSYIKSCLPNNIFPDEELKCSAVNQTNLTIGSLANTWNTINCTEIYQNILYSAPDGTLGYNPNNLSRVQADIDNMIQTYISLGYSFTSVVTSPFYNPFQEKIVKLCSGNDVPGGCDLFLRNYCQQFTYEELGDNATIASICGCYVESPYYNLPTNQGTLPPQCQPICHLTNTAQISNPCTGVIDSCDNTVCIIDNVNINLVNTDVTTAFQQICPGCDQAGQDPCTCIIGGEDVTTTLTDSGAGATYTQYCGTNAQCFILEPDDSLIQTTCPTAQDFNPGGVSYTFPYLIAFVVFVVVVIVILALLANKNATKYV